MSEVGSESALMPARSHAQDIQNQCLTQELFLKATEINLHPGSQYVMTSSILVLKEFLKSHLPFSWKLLKAEVGKKTQTTSFLKADINQGRKVPP